MDGVTDTAEARATALALRATAKSHKDGARPSRNSGETAALGLDPLNVAIRNLQAAHAVATVAERAATHDMVEVHCLADVLVAIIPLIERGLDALDALEARQ